MATTNSSRPSASTAPGTPGWDSDTPRCLPDSTAWTRPNEAKATTSPGDQGHRADDGRLGREHRPAARHRGERGADQAGAVLGAERQHAEHADGQHRVLQADQAGQQRVDRCRRWPGVLVSVTATRALMPIGVATATSRVQ